MAQRMDENLVPVRAGFTLQGPPEKRKAMAAIVCSIEAPCIRKADRFDPHEMPRLALDDVGGSKIGRYNSPNARLLGEFSQGTDRDCLAAFESALDQLHAGERMAENQNIRPRSARPQ